jgi:hypothetical protein
MESQALLSVLGKRLNNLLLIFLKAELAVINRHIGMFLAIGGNEGIK